MSYTTESSVYDTVGFDSTTIQNMSGKTSAQVTTLVTGYISDAMDEIRDQMNYPIRIKQEIHYGDGNKNQFDLGPEDDPHGEESEYDPEDGVVEVYNVWFSKSKMKKPYPETCDLGGESTTGWTGSNVTTTAPTSGMVHGDAMIQHVYSAAGYAQYPDQTNVDYLDRIVDTWSDLFFYAELDDVTATITVRIYDKDGNYAYQDFTLRQNNVGQYVWLDLDTFTDELDWDDVRAQYIQFRSDKACTLKIDNICFADSWAYSAPSGIFHTSVADNISSESPPSEGYPFYVTYGYDPFLSSVPRYVRRATEYLVGMYLIDYVRGIKYLDTDIQLYNETMEADTPFQRGGLLGVRTRLEKNYDKLMGKWTGQSFGVI